MVWGEGEGKSHEMAKGATDSVQSHEEIRDARRGQAGGEGEDWQRVENHGDVDSVVKRSRQDQATDGGTDAFLHGSKVWLGVGGVLLTALLLGAIALRGPQWGDG